MKRIIGELWYRSAEWLDRYLEQQCAALHANSRPAKRMLLLRESDSRSRTALLGTVLVQQAGKAQD